MQVKTRRFLILTLLIISSFSVLPCFAQYEAHTQLNLPEGAKARLGKGHVNEITYSPDGSLLAVATNIGLWVYNAETFQELALLTKDGGAVLNVLFSPDGSLLISGDYDGSVRLWDATTWTLKSELIKRPIGSILSMALSPDGTTLASTTGRLLRLWDVVAGAFKSEFIAPAGTFLNVWFSPDGSTLITVSDDKIQDSPFVEHCDKQCQVRV